MQKKKGGELKKLLTLLGQEWERSEEIQKLQYLLS